MLTRKQYMAHPRTNEQGEYCNTIAAQVHNEYYAQFATKNVVDYVRQAIGTDAIMASNDPHFNDIPLRKWDNLHAAISALTTKLRHEAGDVSCLAFSVCVAKRAAEKIKEEELAKQAAEPMPKTVGCVLKAMIEAGVNRFNQHKFSYDFDGCSAIDLDYYSHSEILDMFRKLKEKAKN